MDLSALLLILSLHVVTASIRVCAKAKNAELEALEIDATNVEMLQRQATLRAALSAISISDTRAEFKPSSWQHGQEYQDEMSPTCPADRFVWWLHFPKCGSSFIESARMCPKSATRLKRNHQELRAFDTPAEVVAMFRQPSQRLASAFVYMQIDPANCCDGDWGWNDTVKRQALSVLNSGSRIADDEFLQSFRGCQTNMILGRGCMSRYKATDVDVDDATRLIDQFLFVGLLEEWPLSICLYNSIVTGYRFVSERQLANINPAVGTAMTHSSVHDTRGFPPDFADDAVYNHAKVRFTSDLVKYDISRASCSFDEHGNPYEIPFQS